MTNYALTIIASGLDPEADDFEDRFFEAGCSDATIAFQKGLIIVEFDREAKNFAHALTTAFSDVIRAGATVERFEPDHLVNLSDIAKRSGLTRGAISHYVKGQRSDGFPSPIARVTSESPLWDWVDVSRWMHKHAKLDHEVVLEARMVREANVIVRSKDVPHDQFSTRIAAIAAA